MAATKADGSILIDTKIRTSGFEEGAVDLRNQFNQMASNAKTASDQMVSTLGGAFSQMTETAKSASNQISYSLGEGVSKSVEMAKMNIQDMETRVAEINSRLNSIMESGVGETPEAASLISERDRLYERISKARRKLAFDIEFAAKKQAEAEAKEAERSRKKIEAEEKKKEAAQKRTQKQESKALKASRKENKSASKSAGSSASNLGTRLKSLAAGAFFFNLISEGLRGITDYMKDAIKNSGEMKQALAGLEGAAKTAAAPIIQAITPALVAMANAAARAFAFIARLISAISGKSIRDMANYAKSLEKGAGAASKLARSLAGFDEIQTLQDNNAGGGSGEIAPDFSIAEVGTVANSIIDKVKEGDWYGVGEAISTSMSNAINSIDWKSLEEKMRSGAKAISLAFNGVFADGSIWGSLGQMIAEWINIAFASFGELGNTIDWIGLGESLSYGINKLVYNIDFKKAAKNLSTGVQGMLRAIITGIQNIDWQAIGNSASEYVANLDWSGLVSTLLEGLGSAFAGFALLLWGIIEPAWDEIVKWWEETAYEDGEFTMLGLLEGIANVFVDIVTWLDENVLQPFVKGVKEVFGIHSPSKVMKELGEFVSDGFVNGFSEVTEKLKAPINGVIGLINKMLSAFAEGFNGIVRTINNVKLTVPDWVPGIGGKTYGFGLKTISAPQIPYLAKGAVIPPNAPFMAVLGDQHHGTNIEAPLETIQQAFRTEVADMVGGMMAGFEASVQVQNQILEAVLAIEIGDTTIGEAAARYSTKQSIIHGG